MRKPIDPQLQLGEIDISSIQFDPRSRDDIPRLLRGLQHLYINPELRQAVFAELGKIIPDTIDKNNGRPGMDLWRILVFGTLRLVINCDFDRLVELTNEHGKLRQMLGHGPYDEYRYRLQTLLDNLTYFTPEVLDSINLIAVNAGHELVKKQERLQGRCDSFVVKTNVRYPTDIEQLWAASRKSIEFATVLSAENQLPGWRQATFLLRQHKKRFNHLRRLKHSSSTSEAQKQANQDKIDDAYIEYLQRSQKIALKAEATLTLLAKRDVDKGRLEPLKAWINAVHYQVGLTCRRVFDNEKIPHSEKIFSYHKPYTEWISKGKAGVPVELGLRVCIFSDQFGFTLHHRVMQKETDDKVTVIMAEEAKKRFPDLSQASYDKGFWNPDHIEKLESFLDRAILPKKGKLSAEDKKRESHPEFIRARRKHSAVESDINALEVHGLDQCPDDGLPAFKRYVALAVLGSNIHRLGKILLDQDREMQLKKAA